MSVRRDTVLQRPATTEDLLLLVQSLSRVLPTTPHQVEEGGKFITGYVLSSVSHSLLLLPLLPNLPKHVETAVPKLTPPFPNARAFVSLFPPPISTPSRRRRKKASIHLPEDIISLILEQLRDCHTKEVDEGWTGHSGRHAGWRELRNMALVSKACECRRGGKARRRQSDRLY